MRTIKRQIQNLARAENPPEVRIAYLAEDFDGIGQYVAVRLSRGSSSSALARVSIGGTSGKFPIEEGARVSVVMVKGTLEVISLGG
jgi:hypothetical protein